MYQTPPSAAGATSCGRDPAGTENDSTTKASGARYIASVAAIMGFPMNSMYVASKHAVAGFSEAFAKEVARFGVKVTSVEPGGFRTEFGTTSLNLPACVSEPYAEITQKLKTRMTDFAHLAANDPAKGAAVIAALVELERAVATRPEYLPLAAQVHVVARRA